MIVSAAEDGRPLRKSDSSATSWPVRQGSSDGKRSNVQGAAWRAGVGREGAARNERDSLPRHVPPEDSFLVDQSGESSGWRVPLADSGTAGGFPPWAVRGKVARQQPLIPNPH